MRAKRKGAGRLRTPVRSGGARAAGACPLAGLTAGAIMTAPVAVLHPEQTVREAAKFLTERRIHGAPVVDRVGRIVGVLSVTDLARHEREREPDLVRESDYHRMGETARASGVPWRAGFHAEGDPGPHVRDLMTPSVVAVDERAGFGEVLEVLRRRRIHRVLVTKGTARVLAGVVSETDLLAAVRRHCFRRGRVPRRRG